MPRLPRSFYRRDPVTVARALLGQRLVHLIQGQRVAGLIVETEAYLGIPDLAAHTARGRRTPRNQSMWLDGGTAYIYFTYGMHYCFNIVTQTPETPTAVLIRALEPTEGLSRMYKNRQSQRRTSPRALTNQDLTSGPARLCSALQLDLRLDGIDLCTDEQLWVEQVRLRAYAPEKLVLAPRIGVDYAGAWAHKPLRFYIRGNPFVSHP